MNEILLDRIIQKLTAGLTLKNRSVIEVSYPPRQLPEGAAVTRICPSPTGFVHIGTIYAALLCERLAHQTGGKYFLRIEDTDKKREVAGGTDMILAAINGFDLTPDEGPSYGGEYGPYIQSERREIYMSYAVDLLRRGRAYPCFATSEELEANTKKQQDAKVRPGYYGKWALWRDRSDKDITEALDADKPFILRFRSEGSHDKHFKFTDQLKGELDLPENDLDVPLIKGDESRLPTYHLAHIVDDYLMQTNLVLRGDEWLPSVPLHIELAEALGVRPFTYAHIAPISIIGQNGGGKRKLSKRKDPEANVAFFYEAGYPVESIKRYLLGLASSDFEDWQKQNPHSSIHAFQLTLEKLSRSRAPLYDAMKLRDVSKDVIGDMNTALYSQSIWQWLADHGTNYCRNNNLDPEIPHLFMDTDRSYLETAFAVERTGDNPRKDVAKWSDVLEEYGYFVDEIFARMFVPRIAEELTKIDAGAVEQMRQEFLKTYDPNDETTIWFEKVKTAAIEAGFTTDNQVYKADPGKFKGNLADAVKILRVSVVGKNRSPDLCAVMRMMGADRVKARLTV